jgi:hypothetical protein
MHKKLLFSLSFLFGLFASNSMASQDGQLGPRSTGEIHIRLVINQGIQISNLEDIEILIDTLTRSDVVVTKRFCVRGNTEGLYTMTDFSDRGGSSPFSMSSNSEDEIDFQLYFRSDLSKSIGDEMKPNVPSRLYQLNNNGVNCNGQDNSELRLIIPAAQINQARDHEYRGFLNMTVAIE